MLAVAGRPPDTAAWAIEMKWDGVRAMIVCDSDRCRLYSRNRRDVTSSYPELAAAIAESARGRELILDGEVIAQKPSGTPSFGLLQRRMHVARPTQQRDKGGIEIIELASVTAPMMPNASARRSFP